MTAQSLDSPPNVGDFVHRLRRARGLTLEDLAGRSGVSKSMLSQIEHNRTNPTVAIVWRLCESLGVGIDAFFGGGPAVAAVEVLAAHATPAIRSADGRCTLRILGPMELGGAVEWYAVDAEPGAVLASNPHESGTMEHLTVLEGALTVESGTTRQPVAVGETVRYRADQPHAIRNDQAVAARALLVVVLHRPAMA